MLSFFRSMLSGIFAFFTMFWSFMPWVKAPAYVLPAFSPPNVLEGASIIHEDTLGWWDHPDAANLLKGNRKCWTPQPADGPVAVEIQLAAESTFNTAYLEEAGNQVQYFRLQAMIGGKWVTFFRAEKIREMRLCSFDAVTTDRVRLVIDEFTRKWPARIRALRLYNEPKRAASDFTVAIYQRLHSNLPTDILARGEDYARTFARFYDVYNTVILFQSVYWSEDGALVYTMPGKQGAEAEAEFARQLDALKQIIALRTNPHEVRIICNALPDTGDHKGINTFMAKHWKTVADQSVAFLQKHALDGLDIDWEFPQNADDWRLLDQFFAYLHDEMQRVRPGAILSAAISASFAGSDETINRIDQIQFMAYDGTDGDGLQSSFKQAVDGIAAFAKRGIDLKKINIGIGAYGRPLDGGPVWIDWHVVQGEGDALYWNSKHYNILYGGKYYDASFCPPGLASDKTAYALLGGAGGVMVFVLSTDRLMDDPNSVARGIENALRRLTAAG